MVKPTTDSEARIGKGTAVRAKIVGSENLVVAGRLEGSLELAGALLVENTGVVKAGVRVERATIAGIVVGDIYARDCVQIAPEGRVLGDIRATRVAIAEGARFSGAIEMMRVEASESVTLRPEARAPISPSGGAWRAAHAIEDVGGELPRAVVVSTVVATEGLLETERAVLATEPVTEIRTVDELPRGEAAVPIVSMETNLVASPKEGAPGLAFMASSPERAKLGHGRKRVVVKKRIS